MATSDNLPKPVVTPYATARDSTSRSTICRAAPTRCLAHGATETRARSAATAVTCSSVNELPSITTSIAMIECQRATPTIQGSAALASNAYGSGILDSSTLPVALWYDQSNTT